jgi:hypothetical protein
MRRVALLIRRNGIATAGRGGIATAWHEFIIVSLAGHATHCRGQSHDFHFNRFSAHPLDSGSSWAPLLT